MKWSSEIDPSDHRLFDWVRDVAKFTLETIRNVAVVSALWYASFRSNSRVLEALSVIGLVCVVLTFMPFTARAVVSVLRPRPGSGMIPTIQFAGALFVMNGLLFVMGGLIVRTITEIVLAQAGGR